MNESEVVQEQKPKHRNFPISFSKMICVKKENSQRFEPNNETTTWRRPSLPDFSAQTKQFLRQRSESVVSPQTSPRESPTTQHLSKSLLTKSNLHSYSFTPPARRMNTTENVCSVRFAASSTVSRSFPTISHRQTKMGRTPSPLKQENSPSAIFDEVIEGESWWITTEKQKQQKLTKQVSDILSDLEENDSNQMESDENEYQNEHLDDDSLFIDIDLTERMSEVVDAHPNVEQNFEVSRNSKRPSSFVKTASGVRRKNSSFKVGVVAER